MCKKDSNLKNKRKGLKFNLKNYKRKDIVY